MTMMEECVQFLEGSRGVYQAMNKWRKYENGEM